MAGLQVQYKYGCPIPTCMYTAAKPRIRDHLKKDHQNNNGLPLENVACQVLNSGAAPTNIRITLPKPQDDDEDSVSQSGFETYDVNTSITLSAPDDRRLISPWLLRTGFHKYVEGKNTADLMKLCSMPLPTEDHMSGLQEIVYEYFQRATTLIEKTDPLILQLLNSSDPQKEGINHTPFREHQEHDTTLRGYIIPVVHLLAMLLRKGCTGITLPSSSTCGDALFDFSTDPTVDTLHAVLKSIWLEEWPNKEGNNFSDPSICFLALFTLQADGHFKHPKDVTRTLAQLCRAIRLTVLAEIHRQITMNPSTSSTDAFRPHALPKIVWPFREEGRFDAMLFLGQSASLQKLLNIIQDLEREAVDIWEHSILRGAPLHITWKILADNLRDTSQGYSFLQEQGNHLKDVRHDLGRFLLQRWLMKEIPGSTQKSLNIAEARVWLTDLARLEAIMQLLVEMKSGAPIRLTELCSTLSHNTEFRLRNLMAFGKRIILIRQYTKNTNNRQMDSLIPCLLAAFEADMLVQIHTYARPIAQWIAFQITGDSTVARAYQDMLFMDLLKPFAPDTISRLLGEKSSKHLGWKMKIKAYRQMTIGFRRQNKIEGIECDIQEDTMRLIYAQQSGHSVSTENRTYGLSPDLVEGLADATIELYLNSSSDWQRLLKVVPGDTTLPYKQCLVENYAKLAADGIIMAHTPTKSTHTDITPLAKLIIELKSESGASHNILMGEIKRLQADIQALKHDIHHQSIPSATLITTPATLAMPQSPAAIHATRSPPARLNLVNVSPLPPLKRPHPTDSIVTSDPPSKKAMLQKRLGDMVDHLSLLVGKETTWRNLDQRSAVACLMTLKRDAIIVLRTGLGKTAIALLPAMVEDCVTVVVVPLIILFEEWESRLQKARIPFDTFAHDRTTPINTGAKVVLVSSDTARFASWKEAIAKLHDIRPVVRMVIDEAHYYFTDLNFRSNALGNPFSLRTLPFQIVLLSATIPPAAEAHLKTEFGLHIPHIIRGLSHRKELKYRILEGGENIEAMVEQFTLYCDQLQEEQQWSDGDRWIVFVPWVAEGYYVADLLGVEFYHADSDAFPITREERSEMYGRFTRGEKKGLVASTALGAGTDYPHIRLTCHLGAMYGMVNFVQQSSRAGRDGKSAHCIVIPNKVPPNSPNREIADLTG
ncbi:P-loop containing nucleoside triphosphate hydrolase protein, partial [Coprinellus micaceus]